MQQTLAIIKPDGVRKKHIGHIITMCEHHHFTIKGMKMVALNAEQVRRFYRVHASRPFFEDLVAYMLEGPVVLMVLEGDGVIEKYRQLMGATDPREAQPGTIRTLYGVDRSANCVHGSDSDASAEEEIALFFERKGSYFV